ncbi:hypothetical protein BDM02DRAFT_3185728 [Thelephora ganbajun]|uniref:Uncharacterized protein n=1 Tax=Thelephora ganbajun TaxID=370292 RepID=A0ACB6ZKA4_THEGA|nr:hypothetical protein BDM02DRAFT_3185728 [Thelephora ganbajun]
MPEVDVLNTTNGHHEEPGVLSPLDDTLSPHPVSTSDAAGESTDETGPPAEHVEEETKDEPPAQKVPSKTVVTKPPAITAKKARVVGAGVIKPVLSKVTAPGIKPSSTASPVKKTPSTITKAAMPPPKPPVPTHTRRTSVVPPKVQPSADKKPLSASTGTKPTLSSSVSKPPAPTITKPPSRASMVSSPDPDTVKPSVRPRASITGAAKRAPSISKPPVGVSKPPPSTAATRPSRTPGVGSVSSLKEIKENGNPPGKAHDDLQQKLDSANGALLEKETAIADLESQVSETKSSLESALADIQEKQAKLEELEQAKAAAEQQLEEVQVMLQVLQDERDADDSAALLESVKAELHESMEHLQFEQTSAKTLQSRITSLESEITSARSELEVLRMSSQLASSDAAAAAVVEHEALLKARADLEAINVETSALKSAHAVALCELQQKLSVAEEKAKEVERLETELATLKMEKEDTANRISELEIEVLEAREAVEEAEDAKSKAESKTKGLENELAKAKVASEDALEGREKSLLAQLDQAKEEHEARAAELQQEQDKLLSQLATLESELSNTSCALEKASREQQLVTDEHAAKLQSLEQSNQATLDALDVELQRIKDELENQGEILAARVKIVKEEHEQRLQEAFQEANVKHGIDLQALRAESAASLEQVTQFHESTVNNLKAEHAAILEEQTGDLSKQISKLTLELKATQDDLAKSKATLVASAHELESLKAQLEVARATAEVLASSAPLDRTVEVNALKKDLADARSDLTALQEVLAATNESIADMSNRHGKDLEEAAETRAVEVTKLKSAYEFELAQSEKEKSDLTTRLSDAQSEIATLKATIATGPAIPAATRALGHGRAGSGTVTKEEIQKMHEAHNLKMGDLQAEYEKKLKEMQEELEAVNNKTKELESEVSRKAMEISYLEQEQEEANDTITRYVRLFGFKSFLGGMLALALIYF